MGGSVQCNGAMSETSTGETATSTEKTTSTEEIRSVVSRVLSLSIFFVGVGVFAAAGFAMHQAGLFSQYRLTYFAVGVVVGVVGVLLWILTR